MLRKVMTASLWVAAVGQLAACGHGSPEAEPAAVGSSQAGVPSVGPAVPVAPWVAPPLVVVPPVSESPTLQVAVAPQTAVPAVAPSQTVPFVGGTLLASRDGKLAVAALPAGDYVVWVDLETTEQTITSFDAGAMPTRLAEDSAGRVYVLLRGAGAVARLDPEQPTLIVKTDTLCAEPRGLTYVAAEDRMIVACRSGELVWLDLAGDVPVIESSVRLGSDLRDVVASETGLWVSTFRSAQLLQVAFDGTLLQTLVPATVTEERGGVYEPHVALRTLLLDDGRVLMQHQRANQAVLPQAYYAARGCGGGVVHNTFSVLSAPNTTFESAGILPTGTMLDGAVSKDGKHYAFLANQGDRTAVFQGDLDDALGSSACDELLPSVTEVEGQATSITFDTQGRVWVQLASPSRLVIVGETQMNLSAAGLTPSSGQKLFYAPTPSGVSCAHCHPEGEDDGVTWPFPIDGWRRTQPLSGRISATLPLHWRGERVNMTELLNDTLVTRMGGVLPSEADQLSLTAFLDGLPSPRPARPIDDEAVIGGRAAFEKLECNACHSGSRLTDNLNHDVGTGADFQTPSLLGLSYRLPVMHDGCAKTVADRFGSCGGDERHGDLAAMSEADLGLLVAYLEAL